MRFITLTYYKMPNYDGHGAKVTEKEFLQNVETISRITEYDESTKLTMTTGEIVDVCETKHQILGKIHEAETL